MLILIIVGVFILLFLLCLIVIDLVQKFAFGKRGDGYVSIKYEFPSEYKNLDVKKDYFLNDSKTKFATFEYRLKNNKNPKALILLMHGVGCGHFYLLSLIDRLCKEGYLVFCYDHYASGCSEGRCIDSMVTGARDVKYAIDYIDKNYKQLPLYVMGHSWGGYCASITLYYSKRIEKCIDFCGFNTEADVVSNTVKPAWFIRFFMSIRCFLKYGKVALYSSAKAFKNTNAKVLYIQGKDDKIVNPKDSGYKFLKLFDSYKNIEILMLDNKGHSPFYTIESEKKQNDDLKDFPFIGCHLPSFNSYVDYSACSEIDEVVFSKVIEFLKD